MIFKIKKILSFSLLISITQAQFISNSHLRTLPSELNGGYENPGNSFLDPSRFNINQAFSMNMINSGGQSLSLASFANNINYKFSENIDLNANIVISNPLGHSLTNNPMRKNEAQISYDAGITYRPTKNTLFQIHLASYDGLYYLNRFSGRTADRFRNYNRNKNIFELE